ncbi:dienelactone hydrolase family protein [Streptomyces sp. NPDC127098]|uniref:dienelactone hydrolase family protein n=1 Tax=Streptomyces sp. NPDC127098 TaxID=3347137 RepID=UPI00365C3658
MNRRYTHLGAYSDWAERARLADGLFPAAPPGPATRDSVRRVLDGGRSEPPREVRVERSWRADGLRGEVVSWSVGYGPRTEAFVLRPDTVGPLPGVVAMHEHAGVKYHGREKIADGPAGPPRELAALRDTYYGGRAWANALARRGFVVLVHDVFMWGSRRFELDLESDEARREVAAWSASADVAWREPSLPERYDVVARDHEHTVAKYCTLLGTSVAGTVLREDGAALRYLTSRPDVDAGRVGCVGFSGGGARAVLLRAVHDEVAATVVVGMMSGFAEMLDRHVAPHSWMLFPPGLGRVADWPEVAACRAPDPLQVQYLRGDALFSAEGMRTAHRRLRELYERSGHPEGYAFRFADGPHRFDVPAQEAAFDFLGRTLGGASGGQG